MTHLETFLDCLKGLPNDFQRTFSHIHMLDSKSNKLKRKLHSEQDKLLAMANHKHAKGASGGKVTSGAVPAGHATEPTLTQLGEVRDKQWELYNYANEKIALADQAQTMIKAFVTRLDEDIKKLEDILGPEVPPEPKFEPPKSRKVDRSKSAKGSGPPPQGPPISSSTVSARGTQRAPPPRSSAYHSMMSGGPNSSPNKDSNEPRYCHCQQVSFGEMVGCDGATCRFEWFHLACVGLKKPPKGKWYCEDCR